MIVAIVTFNLPKPWSVAAGSRRLQVDRAKVFR